MPEYLHPFIVVRRCYTAICRPGKASIFKVGIIIADLVQEFLAWSIHFDSDRKDLKYLLRLVYSPKRDQYWSVVSVQLWNFKDGGS